MSPVVAIALIVIAAAAVLALGYGVWTLVRPHPTPAARLMRQASKQLALAERAVERGRPGLANDYADMARQLMEMAHKEAERK